MTRQAIQLGLLPRIHISQTSEESYGQIYVGFVNWALMALTLILTITFQSSDRLAAAFGIAVSLTMLLTSALMFVAMREVWRWSLPVSLIVAGLFMTVDSAYVAANLVKFFEGGWIPLVVAAILFFLMSCWSEGYAAMRAALEQGTLPLEDFVRKWRARERVAGTAVYLAGRRDLAPMALLENLKHNKALHERVVFLQVSTEHIPRVEMERRVELQVLKDGFYTMLVHYGFMEQPDIPRALLWECFGCPLEFTEEDTSYFAGRFSLVTETRSRWKRFRFEVFRLMHRNALSATEFFRIPPGRVVELGGQVEI